MLWIKKVIPNFFQKYYIILVLILHYYTSLVLHIIPGLYGHNDIRTQFKNPVVIWSVLPQVKKPRAAPGLYECPSK